METPKTASKLSSSTEYALIFGAGASAAMSLAAQQIAAASVPVTALVAIGLLNRRRLDRHIQSSEPLDSLLEEQSPREQAIAPPTVTATPAPVSPTPTAPRPTSPSTPALNPTMSAAATPMMSSAPPRFSSRHQRLVAAKQALQAAQAESLEKIGAQLQQLRTERGMTLQEIHQRTYIQRYALQAIEQGDLEALPEPFYICAFIKKYAIALGLPGSDIASQFPVA